MEDNPSTDDEIKDSPTSPKSGGKKLKLNDGSSQDSLQDTVLKSDSLKKDENVDSGISADKSESTSSDDRAAATAEGPSNEVVNAAPSGSNVRSILLSLRRPRCTRFYRKRKTPDRDSDSSRDSDDLPPDDTAQNSRSNEDSGSDDDEIETDGLRRLAGLAQLLNPNLNLSSSGGSTSNSSSASSDTSDTNSNDSDDDTFESEHVIEMNDDSDSDDERPHRSSNANDDDEPKGKTPPVLQKTRPKHNYLMLREIINREMGLTFPCGKTAKEDVMFEKKFYGSLHVIYRMKKLHNLLKHKGCVNSINFHPEGHLLASGSDDTNVVVWDWARNIPVQTIKTGHKSNVFQSKFLYLNARSQLNIVTCARDGQVRLLQCHPGGGAAACRRRLAAHSRAAHKLHVTPAEPHAVLSAGEDGLVMQCDVRADHVSRLFQVRERGATVPLYSVSGHPLEPRSLVVAGRDRFVRLYDTRRSTRPVALYSPRSFNDSSSAKKKFARTTMHLTCAVYNHDGTEILGSYNDDDIYLFDVVKDVYDKDAPSHELSDGYTHRYSGHRNSATFKGVAFFGPKSEFVVSGSDCSYIYIWDKNTEAIVQWLQGDMNGVVNCIEAHPRCPVLATSGLDKDVKIWIPKDNNDPTYQGMERVVRENNSSKSRSPLFNDFLPSLYNAWRGENRFFSDDDTVPFSYGGNIEFEGNDCTTF
ncbi:DDB1- and CUL4-associated factor 8 [Anticarsia gemmatalis]|uniref:DDB1- and CUL4-associated factor 8 n=1 Tax=Anticarsia gemmatalis TaxID=129554 RepID=UPI003F7652D6